MKSRRNDRSRSQQKRREQKLAARSLVKKQWDRETLYPKFRIESGLANPGFAKLVERTVSEIDLADSHLFPGWVPEYFRLVAELGSSAADAKLLSDNRHIAQSQAGRIRVVCGPQFQLGQVIVDRLITTSPSLFPFNDVQVIFRNQKIVLGLSSMMFNEIESENGQSWRIYYSRLRPTVKIDGRAWKVAFSRHAIDAICDRFKPDYKTYGGLGDAHALFSSLAYFEPCELGDGTSAISIFDFCLAPGFWEYDNYVTRLMPNAPARDASDLAAQRRSYGYRVGYCPLVFNEGHAIAKTFLSPGFSKTPERTAINQSGLSRTERDRLIKIAENIDFHTLRSGDAFEAIEWFHKNGVAQTIDRPEPLFDSEYLSRRLGGSSGDGT